MLVKFVAAFFPVCLLVVLLRVSVVCDNDKVAVLLNQAEGKNEKNQEEKSNVFVATDKWQEIQNGQQIPAGLHVRLNLQTGKKEAKIIKEREDGNNLIEISGPMKDALARISDDTLHPEIVQRAENAFKSIDQIKKDFQEMKINFKTDYEILQELIVRLREANITDHAKLMIYADLEYIVHQFDNAQDFVQMGGMQLVIPALNSTNDEVRAAAAFLLGSAMQSNPRVQIAALENVLLMQLVRIIIWDPSTKVQNRAMFALSCLVRHFPLAQERLIDEGGFAALAEMFRHRRQKTENNRLLLKVITLISDLMQEQQIALESFKIGDQSLEEKLRQYQRVQLSRAVREQGWCTLIPQHLPSPEHDEREKILQSMLTFVDNCHSQFASHLKTLYDLRNEYQLLAEKEAKDEEDDERYFAALYQLANKLLNLLNTVPKDEL